MNFLRLIIAIIALGIASPAGAQWQTPNHSVPVGQGSGNTGFKSAAPGTSGNALVSNGPSADPTFQPIQAPPFLQFGTGATSRAAQSKMRDTFSVLDFIGAGGGNCIADGITDCAPAINAAVAAASAYSVLGNGVQVYVPGGPNCYRIASSINVPRNVSIIGDGGKSSCIKADNVNAIVYSFTSGGGNTRLEGISLVGVNATAARAAVSRTPTVPTNSDDSMSGLTIRDVLIDNFDTGIFLFTAIMVNIDNVTITDVNQGILFQGFGGAGSIRNTKILKLAGGGTGGVTFTGVDFAPFTYTSGATPGTLGPEGVVIDNETSINGFAIGVNYQLGNWFSVVNSDIVATQYGVKFGANSDGLTIRNNYIVMKTSSAVAGVYGPGQAAVPNTSTKIMGNVVLGDATTTVLDGIRINDTGTSKQDNVTIEGNLIRSVNGYDIAFYNPGGKNRIADNRCKSVGNTGSIIVGTIQSGSTVVEGNVCENTITNITAGDVTNGFIRFCNNTFNGGTDKACTWSATTNNTTAGRLMIGGGAGVQPTAAPAGTATQVYHGNNTYSSVANADLTNSSLTLGSTNVALGATVTALAGLTSVTSTTFVGALTGHASLDCALTGCSMTGGITGITAFSAGVDGSIATLGPSGAGALNAVLRLEGSSATAQGAYVQWRKGGVGTWFLGHVSAIEAAGASSDLEYFNSVTSARTIRLFSADDSVGFAASFGGSTTTVGALPTCNAAKKAYRFFVTDSNAASYTAGIGAVVAAGGTTNVPVTCDGTNWRVG